MDNQKNIQDELRSLDSDLPVNSGPNPFSVPEGYFDGLAAQILAKAKTGEQTAAAELQELSPLLAGLPRSLPYAVPDGYFEQNLAVLPSFQKEEDSALLQSIGKETPYTVPAGYFEQLPQQILNNLPRSTAKLVPFFSRTWTRVAVAAAIGGLVFIGGHRLLNGTDETGSVAVRQPSADTTNPVAKNNTAIVQAIKNVSSEDVEEFMKSVPYNPVKTRQASLNADETVEVRELLKNVSQQEIDAFLEAVPTADENLLLID